MRGWLLPRVASQVVKAKPKNRHVRVLKQPLVAATEEKTSTQNRLKRPQIRKAAVLPGEASREIWQEENGKGKEGDRRRIAIAPLAGAAGAALSLQRKWQRRATPTVGGIHTVPSPEEGWAEIVEFCSLLSVSMTQCVVLMEAPFGCKGLGKCATIKPRLTRNSSQQLLCPLTNYLISLPPSGPRHIAIPSISKLFPRRRFRKFPSHSLKLRLPFAFFRKVQTKFIFHLVFFYKAQTT